MQEKQSQNPVVADLEKVKDLFERLEENALLPLELEADKDYDDDDVYIRARNAIFFLKELKGSINYLITSINAEAQSAGRPIVSHF